MNDDDSNLDLDGYTGGWAKPRKARRRHLFRPAPGHTTSYPFGNFWMSQCGKWWDPPEELDPEKSPNLFVDCESCLSHINYPRTSSRKT